MRSGLSRNFRLGQTGQNGRYNWPDGGPIGSGANRPGPQRRALPCPIRSTRPSSAASPTGQLSENSRLPDDPRARGRARHQSRHGPGRLSAARRTKGSSTAASAAARWSAAAERAPAPFRVNDLVSRRVAELPEESPVVPTPPLCRRFLAPGSGRAILSARRIHPHAGRRLEPAAATSGSTLPRSASRSFASRSRGGSSRAASRAPGRDPGRQRRAAGARPSLPHLHRSRGRRRDGVADVLGRAGAGAARPASRCCRCRWTPKGPMRGRCTAGAPSSST